MKLKIVRKRDKGIVALLLLFCIAMIFSVEAYGEPQTPRVVKVGYIDYGGFVDQDENGDYYGYCVDYLNEISNYTGWKYQFVHDSFTNLLKMLKSGEIDMLCQTQKTPEREAEYLFSDYQVGVEIAALYVADKNSENYYYDDAQSLNGMKVAMMEGSAQNDMFAAYAREKGFSYETVEYVTVEECFSAVVNGEADGLVMGSLAGQDKEGLRVAGRFSSDPYYVMTGKGNTELLEQINQAQYELTLQQPYLEANLYQKYYEDTSAFSGILFTREEGEAVKANPKLTVALRNNSLPLSTYSTEEGAYGIIYDLMEAVGENAGLKFQYTVRNDGESSEMYLKKNEQNATIGVFMNAASQEGLVVSDAIFKTSAALVGNKGSSFSYDASESSYRIAVPKSNTRLQQYIRGNFPQCIIESCETNADCLQMVSQKDADYAALTLEIATSLLSDPHYEDLIVLNASFLSEDYCLAMQDTPGNRLRISVINKSLRAFPTEASEQIQIRHATEDRHETTFADMCYLYRFQIIIGLGLLGVIFLLLVSYVIFRNNNVKKLKLAVAKADKANRAKSEFLSRMSHDIRTPLNAVLGYARLAKQDVEDPAEQEKDLRQIEESGNFLLGLVNDVLDMSKIESEAIVLKPELVQLDEFKQQLEGLFAEKCRKKKIVFHTEIRQGVSYIKVDKIRFKQIFFNLLSNAVKFTNENGNIWLLIDGSERKGEKILLHVTVKDDGIGMSQEFQKHVFDTFAQEHTRASGMEGSGLGLSIVKQLVERMEGTISVKSKKGTGTSFEVCIPVESAKEEELELVRQENHDRTVLQGRKVLLCEDHAVNAALVIRLLEQVGMKVVHAENGLEGLENFIKSETGEYAAILMDIRMPVMDGLEATKKIRRLDRVDAATIPILALTANAYAEDRKSTEAAGMNAHLAKPINPNELYDTLAALLKKL